MLRDYQKTFKANVEREWASGVDTVLAVLPTGGGKTKVFSNIIAEHSGRAVAVAHRQELVTQISCALAAEGVQHRIIAPDSVVRLATALQVEQCGRSYYNPLARAAVASVDTLEARADALASWCDGVSLWVMDEGHHVLSSNKWGRGVAMFPRARGLGVTATPMRADGKGLGREYDGVYGALVVGPDMRDLISRGYLTDYRIFAPANDIDLSGVPLSQSTGDYSTPKLTKAVRRSHIVGDVVDHYKRIAPGRLGVTFATDVQTAGEIAQQFNAAGVPADVVSAKTPAAERVASLRKFKNREIIQLVNVDLFGEGFDLPALEVVSMARPTESYGLYAQQFGRALRVLPGKTEAIIIDHVGNVVRHGLPDAPRLWSLKPREKRSAGKKTGLKVCPNCTGVYNGLGHDVCPFCEFKPVPADRTRPEMVDGDLTELDPATLDAMRKAIEKIDRDPEEYRRELIRNRAPIKYQFAHVNRHAKRRDLNVVLRDIIDWWAGVAMAGDAAAAMCYRNFYHTFGVDVLTAQSMSYRETEELTNKVVHDMGVRYARLDKMGQ